MKLSDAQIKNKVIRVQEALKAADGSMPPDAQVYKILKNAGVTLRIQPFVLKDVGLSAAGGGSSPLFAGSDSSGHPTDYMTEEEQFAAQKRDLYDRSLSGDMQAKKIWFDLQAEETSGNEFNLVVSITPYEVADTSLSSIAHQADTPVVQEILKGLSDRMVLDEAPYELRNLMKQFSEEFSIWAEEAYAPKDA